MILVVMVRLKGGSVIIITGSIVIAGGVFGGNSILSGFIEYSCLVAD